VSNNFKDSSCRGTLLYVIKQLNASPLPLLVISRNMFLFKYRENVMIEIMIVENVYRSPNSSCNNDLKLIREVTYAISLEVTK